MKFLSRFLTGEVCLGILMDVGHGLDFLSRGTRSLLYGVHCPLVHPFVVARAWHALYGRRTDLLPTPGFRGRCLLWAAFFLHDIGYFGCRRIDDARGERHPERGAAWLYALARRLDPAHAEDWYHFSLYHSRHYAKAAGVTPSLLCAADKLASSVEPAWLYLPRAALSTELEEYLETARTFAPRNGNVTTEELAGFTSGVPALWYAALGSYTGRWAHVHADGRADAWTPAAHQLTAKDLS